MSTWNLESAQAAMEAQPFSRLLGGRVTAIGDGTATLELELDEDLCRDPGYADGGVLTYVAENAAMFAAVGVLGPALLTSGLLIDYIRPVLVGPLESSAVVDEVTADRAVCRITISDPEGVCAVAFLRVKVRDISPVAS